MFKDKHTVDKLYLLEIFKFDIKEKDYFTNDDRCINGKLNNDPKTFIGILNFIREQYRNKVAHKGELV